MRHTISILIISIGILSSCRSTRNVPGPLIKKDTVVTYAIDTLQKAPIEDSNAFILAHYNLLINNRINYTTFSAKIDVDYQDADGKKINANAHVRMHKDSLIWVSITGPLGIEGLRAFITKDSVKLLDKQSKVYTARSVSYLQEVTALPLDLAALQDLIAGNPVFFDPAIRSYSKSDNNITLESYGKFFKHLLTIGSTNKLPQQSKLFDLDTSLNRTSDLIYEDYENKRQVNFSTRRAIHVSGKKTLDIKLNFKQYAFNETLTFPFTIPKSYTRE